MKAEEGAAELLAAASVRKASTGRGGRVSRGMSEAMEESEAGRAATAVAEIGAEEGWLARSTAMISSASLSVCAERAFIWALAAWACRRSSLRWRDARSLRFLEMENEAGGGRVPECAVVDTSSRGSNFRLMERRRSFVGRDAAVVGVGAVATSGAVTGRFGMLGVVRFVESTAPMDIWPPLLWMTKVEGAVALFISA